jgi:hypothetical protein
MQAVSAVPVLTQLRQQFMFPPLSFSEILFSTLQVCLQQETDTMHSWR